VFTFTLPPNRAAGTICCAPPATSFIWTNRSPVSGDLLLSLAALSIPAQVVLQRDFQLIAIGLEHEGLDQRTNGLHGACAALRALQRKAQAPNLLAIDVGHPRVQQLRHLRSVETRLQFDFPRFEREELVLEGHPRDAVFDRLNELPDLALDAGELLATVRQARAMLHSESIQLPHVLTAEVFEQVAAHQLVA
jgi:hypothetical protein